MTPFQPLVGILHASLDEDNYTVISISYFPEPLKSDEEMGCIEPAAGSREVQRKMQALTRHFPGFAGRSGAIMTYRHVVGSIADVVADLRDLPAKASPSCSGDRHDPAAPVFDVID